MCYKTCCVFVYWWRFLFSVGLVIFVTGVGGVFFSQTGTFILIMCGMEVSYRFVVKGNGFSGLTVFRLSRSG